MENAIHRAWKSRDFPTLCKHRFPQLHIASGYTHSHKSKLLDFPTMPTTAAEMPGAAAMWPLASGVFLIHIVIYLYLFFLTSLLWSDIFISSSDKYISLEDSFMKNNIRRTIILGVICVLLVAAASWYTIVFNDARFIVPMELSEYTFQAQDIPMIISGVLLILYILYLFILLLGTIVVNGRKGASAQVTRAVNPKLGFLGFLGFIGLLGFWTYSVDKTIFPFVFFLFFGFFGFFYEGKMSNTYMDERYKENKMKAGMMANRIALAIIFFAILILGQGKFMGSLDYTLIALIIIVALSIALQIFLSEYLLYRYDHDDQLDESEE